MSNFEKMEISARSASVIQERINLVSTHMYKQYLEYQQANNNTTQVFLRLVEYARTVVECLKQSFSTRGISGQNIYFELEQSKALIKLNILWHSISIMAIGSDKPQALYREKEAPVFSGRIVALNGKYQDIIRKVPDNELPSLLEYEIASLFVPADKNASAIMKIRHLGNKEVLIQQPEAAKEFLVKVVEIICGGGIYHEESIKKTF